MFDAVLVANRGEIAVRIIRTLRRLGIRSVAVFSDADRRARHVREADAAVHIGPSASALSYLDVGRIVDAAVSTGAQALHPGYGFLSENAALARACSEAGVTFVGPGPLAIEAMGDKIRAKETVSAHGVRVVPGVSGFGLSPEQLAEAAFGVGLPLILKPSAGGGGKGMRLVRSYEQLDAEIRSAQREATAAFGDDTLLIERYLERPRHIEVQILADGHGNVVHLGERECSLQRRHQKVIEEAPSPYLSPAQRTELGAQAVAAARACGYVNAGTVEFIVSGEDADEAYFLEMNTRLQVEHPVTEMVWGIDLVEHQLRIAAGERLAFTQDDLAPVGHAFEARIYAEAPSLGFLPTGGVVEALHEPVHLPDVRIDSSLSVGTVVGSDYDPMLAKVIAWGHDRDTARRRLRSALGATAVHGVTTNTAFLRAVLDVPDVVAGVMDTGLLEGLTPAPETPEESARAAVAAALALMDRDRAPGAWGDRRGWRLGAPAWSRHHLIDADGAAVQVHLRTSERGNEARVGDETWSIDVDFRADTLRLGWDGTSVTYHVAFVGASVSMVASGRAWRFAHGTVSGHRPGTATGDLTVVSPMPGAVLSVEVAVGDDVTEGAPIVVVEAMKMEHTLRAPHDAVVAEVLVRAGDQVKMRQTLVVLAPAVVDAPEAHPPGSPPA